MTLSYIVAFSVCHSVVFRFFFAFCGEPGPLDPNIENQKGVGRPGSELSCTIHQRRIEFVHLIDPKQEACLY